MYTLFVPLYYELNENGERQRQRTELNKLQYNEHYLPLDSSSFKKINMNYNVFNMYIKDI